MLEVERGQRELLQSAYLQTVSALASALESKDTGTRAHSQRVQSYATALADAVGQGSHHERWDGRGYPDGLVRDEIPLGARIFAIADALDAMTTHRPYRRAMSWSAARAEILEQRKRQFDPDVIDAFVTVEPALREIRREELAAA